MEKITRQYSATENVWGRWETQVMNKRFLTLGKIRLFYNFTLLQ
jgi:hypothetical protein